ncbi:MAG: putative transport system permease protein [Pseudomonadota bacterium]|nr:putative transport system permease protein [Pseudomonadota bacterium]
MLWIWWQLIIRYAWTYRLRSAVQVLAITVGVALGYAVSLINTAALAEFNAALREINGEADAVIEGSRAGFDEQLYARVASDPGVQLASPVLATDVLVAGSADEYPPRLTVLGIDVLRAAPLSPTLMGDASLSGEREASRFAIFGDGILLSPSALERFKLQVGDSLTVQAGSGTVELKVRGTLPGVRPGSLLGVMDLGFAQWRLGALGRLTRIDLRLADGVSLETLRARLALPPGVNLAGPDATGARLANLSRAYRVNLNVLALVALFTGGFLVFSLQAQATLARRAQFAWLRAAGLERGQLKRLLIAEALAIGAVGSLCGLFAGAAIAQAALTALGGDLGGGYFNVTRPALGFPLLTAAGFAVLGVLAAVAGSYLPAHEAAHTPPAAALHAGGEEDVLRPLGRIWPGLVLLGVAAVLLSLPPVSGVPVPAYLAIAAILIGAIALQPRIARLLSRPLADWLQHARVGTRAPTLLLAANRMVQAPGAAAIAMAGIVASFGLMVAMGTMVSSFRGTLDGWLVQVLPADLYARVGLSMTDAWLSPADMQRIRTHPGVLRVEFSRATPLQLAADRAAVVVVARTIDATDPGAALPLVGRPLAWQPDQPPPVWVSEAMVDLYGARVGGILHLPLAGGLHPFIVLGVWRDYARQFGSVAMRAEDYQRITGDSTRTDAAIWLRPGVRAADVSRDLLQTLDSREVIELRAPAEIRALSLRIFDRSFAVTYVLEAAAILIGMIGVAATFSSQAMARSREFGMLRHIGVTRGQILRVLALEGALATLNAIVVGLLAGLVIALVLIRVVNPQSFHWSMQLIVPLELIAGLIAALLVCATGTAAIAGRRATGSSPLRAVHEDW